MAGFVLMALAGVAALWVWTDSDTSLATALRQSSRFLPAGQALRADDVRGTLRSGGQIGLLRWEKDGLVLEAHRIDLAWQPMAWLDRRLQLDSLRIGELVIVDQRPSTHTTPLDNLVLPFNVDLKFAIDSARWGASGNAQASNLAGHYQFDGTQHRLRLDRARVAAGQYSATASLLALAPLALDVEVQGSLEATVPGGRQPVALTATGSAKGVLAGGPAALLEVRAQVNPTSVPASAAKNKAANLEVSGQSAGQMTAAIAAQLKPWSIQPVVKVDASFSRLNLAVLWPDTPTTMLDGSATVTPAADTVKSDKASASAWRARLNFTNTLSGPWNAGRLPVDAASAELMFKDGQWLVESINAEIAGGRVVAKGQISGAPLGQKTAKNTAGWMAQASLQNINPAALHSQLESMRLDGTLNANTDEKGIVFETRLRPSPRQPDGTRLKGLRIKAAFAQGRWAAGRLNAETLQVQTSDALLEGQVEVTPATKAIHGQLKLRVPGGQAHVRGQISATAGDGDFSIRVLDASLASRWFESLPGAAAILNGHTLKGNGEISGQWTGGWGGTGSTLQTTLRVPRLTVQKPTPDKGEELIFRNIEAAGSGRVGALSVKASGQIEKDARQFTVETQFRGGRSGPSSAEQWLFSVSDFQVQMTDPALTAKWTAKVQQAVQVSWRKTGTENSLEVGSGSSSLTGPIPGTAVATWKPIRWSRSGGHQRLSTEGQIQAIPMAWLDFIGNLQMEAAGLRGDLVFDGNWDVSVADTVKGQVSLKRRSGDITILAGQENARINGSASGMTTAGVTDARFNLAADGENLRASALWQSSRAGTAQGELTTRIAEGKAGWYWPEDAPLAGTLKAQMPQVGVWSVLAPPGWRIRGTLDASLALAGTRQAPNWRGNLNADNLAVRSVADGIEFNNGKLRSQLVGQRLEITEFSLQGSPVGGAANTGGTLVASGSAQWLGPGADRQTALSKMRVELDLQAKNLRLSARADRRIAVSGRLQTTLQGSKLDVRGALKADQALYVLPDEDTPSLGNDVIVKQSRSKLAEIDTLGLTRKSSVAPAGSGVTMVPNVAITLDMGQDFRVQGRGLTTRLAGSLNLTSSSSTLGVPRLAGMLSTVGGSYKAYGQTLDIEEGLLRFSGPYDNPALDILAIRPNMAVRVGVQISGTALLPRVRLFAEPDLPEAEKLAWLVLGRSGANGGAESAVLQQAAMALLGGNGTGLSGGLAEALGLDQLSFRGSTAKADGTTSSAAVTLGKRLSRNFYVAYERSVSGTLGTVYIFYDLSRRFTLRAQTGEQSALDLIFTVPYE